MSDEVNDFLRSVKELQERREEEDEARSKELEEKFLQEKRERQARRAERARSISPQKSSPANTPPPLHRNSGSLPLDGVNLAPSSPLHESSDSPRLLPSALSLDPVDPANDTFSHLTSPTKENDSPFDADTKRTSVSMTSPATSGPASRSPLSWQRRPTSQGSERPKSRPLSVVAAENAAARSTSPATEGNSSSQTLSRDQIASSLSSRDPSFFRQTADRGLNSPAFRKSQVEDQDTLDMSSMRAQLPGMESAKEPQLGSPLTLAPAPRLDPPSADKDVSSGDPGSILSSPGRTSPTRPVSPTKGVGGFVQSAMMKRSDSVKRWSVSSPTGLQRADTVASNRGNGEPIQRISHSRTGSRLGGSAIDDSTMSISRPASRPTSSAGKQVEEPKEAPAEEEQVTPPTSPSKTMDPRRWSPTKSSSWLDAALNKPEVTPKSKPTPPPSNQPAWMVELNKAKAQRATGSADLGRNPSTIRKHEVKTGGLMRSSPMGTNVKPAPLSPFSPSTTSPAGSTDFRKTLTRSNARPDSQPKEEQQSAPSEAAKVKPETPPKRDLRAALKPRVPPPASKSPPAELKNVFGSLRKATTQNYVAPDEFKGNILRGKASLNLTGGPKKTERQDDFKEAILKKKDDFKKAQQEGRGITRNLSSASENPVPEGLAKRLEMSHTGGIARRGSATSDVFTDKAEKTDKPVAPHRTSVISNTTRRDSADVSSPISLAPKRTSTVAAPVEPAAPVALPGLHKETSAPARLQKAGGGLADRFNPALAGILARGPPGMATGSSGHPAAVSAKPEEPLGPGPQLTHMTKGRARGPKRKAPSAVASGTTSSTSASATGAIEAAKEPAMSKPAPSTFNEAKSTGPSSGALRSPPVEAKAFVPSPQAIRSSVEIKPPVPAQPLQLLVETSASVAENPTSAPGKKPPTPAKPQAMSINTKPAEVTKVALVDSSDRHLGQATQPAGQPIAFEDAKPKTRPRSPTKIHEQVAAIAARAQQASQKSPIKDENPVSQPSSPKKLDLKRMSKFLDESGQTISGPEALRSQPSSPVKANSPTKSWALPDPVAEPTKAPAKQIIDTKPGPSVKNGGSLFGSVGLGLSNLMSRSEPRAEPAAEPSPTSLTNRAPRPVSIAVRAGPTSPQLSTPSRSPSRYGADISTTLAKFFGPERPKREYKADVADVLTHKPVVNPKIVTQKVQLFQMASDGKKVPVPQHNERVLFEQEMYLCLHTFTDENGKRVNQVYFWAGDEVSESAVEDAQLFASREARAFGGKLVKLFQGKETPEFLQALGGIVMIRRGSSNKYDSLATSILCGRRYLGQVVFDEVDFVPASLCSGFAYLLTQQGKCFLWKGKGSNVDELSGARLLGMDLALMSELMEIEDGSEPDTFWTIFGDEERKPHSADHWRLKPNYDKYSSRLFLSNSTDKKQITEISPFTQSDLLPSNVYILDAFFEMYIIVGARAQHQYAAFHNALDFAQEYAILASGMEDRPFIPVSTVVLEGVPRDLKSVFRKWQDTASPTITNPNNPTSPSLRRGRSLRIVPLNQALLALKDS